MNPLLAQFLLEARDGLRDIDARLLALETDPTNSEGIAALFRTVHTLKGNAGLFDFPELTRVLHAAEDLMDAVRQQAVRFDEAMADALLAAMDFTGILLEEIESQGTTSARHADEARRLGESLRALRTRAAVDTADHVTGQPVASALSPAWTDDAWAQLPATVRQRVCDARARDWHWVEYTPETQCFFQGDDPLHLMRQVPGVHWASISPTTSWPALEALDPYQCSIVVRALVHAPRAALDELFRYVIEQVRFHAVSATPMPASDDHASVVSALRAQQQHILRLSDTDASAPGRRRAAELVLKRLDEYHAAAHAADSREAGNAFDDDADAGRAGGADVPPVGTRRAEDTALRHLKVDQHKIDRLLQLIGEMVVAKNALPFLAQKADAGMSGRDLAREIKNQHAVMHRVAEELQDTIRQVRMLPVQVVFQRFPRLVRDLAARLGKQVRLVLEGESAEADKHILEGLAEPLVHLVRNSLDHGLEAPDERVASGKPTTGTLILRAVQGADRLVITVRDDGRGIDPARIRRKVQQRALMDEDALARLDDREVTQLVFLPGFSTAESVSDLSGRGVGMDAVRDAILRLGGTLQLDSAVGAGTTMTLSLPLSLTVSQVMVVESGGQRFGVPLDRVLETVRVGPSERRAVAGGEVMVRRGQLIPLLSVPSLLNQGTEPMRNAWDEQAVLVVQHGDRSLGLCVDAFGGGQDVMLSPLPGVLAGLPTYAGSALLGDGTVLMVLNLEGLLA
jgi:two-component system, chemotaxis family, sensor kinase CheA